MNALKEIYRSTVSLFKMVYAAITCPFTMAKEELQGKAKSVKGRAWSLLRILTWGSFAAVSFFFPAAPLIVVATLSYFAWLDLLAIFGTTCLLAAATVFGDMAAAAVTAVGGGVFRRTEVELNTLGPQNAF